MSFEFFELSPDQRMFIDIYACQYEKMCEQNNQMQEQIQRNTTTMNELRYNIQTIYIDVSTHIARQEQPLQPPMCIPIPSSTTSFSLVRHLFSDIEHPLNKTCPISHATFEPSTEVVHINQCGHIVSRLLLSHWFQTNTICPLCGCSVK